MTSRATTGGAINIRVRDDDRALIDQAALLSGKSRSEFMLEAARHAAGEAILDRTLFRMAPAAFARFTAMLDAPPQPNAKLHLLMQTKAPWE
ncbi:MAG: CopG family transcriptional regulator [Rhodospirillales bacterium 70-18]|nr:MAG: CopG family transcriptional regulator [Rhodospirillales bacterium 70-18]